MKLHSLLQSQLEKTNVDVDQTSGEITELIRVVNQAYHEFDADRSLRSGFWIFQVSNSMSGMSRSVKRARSIALFKMHCVRTRRNSGKSITRVLWESIW